jgi:PAS domain S-box-containing protein
MFAIGASLAALYAFNQYRKGFDQIASSNLPTLIAASDLAQRSQAISANAPNLAVAESHFARQAVGEALRGQLEGIAEIRTKLANLAPTAAGLADLARNEASLKANLETLDRLVADRIEADGAAANLTVRLRNLATRMRAASTSQYSSLAAAGGQTAETEALNTWTAAASEAIAVMLSTSSADTSVRLIRLRSDFEALAAQANAALDRLTPATVAALEPMERAMMQYSHGSPNIFNTRAAQLAAESAVRGALLENKQLSAQFVASAASVFKSIQDDTHAQSDFFSGLIAGYSRLFIIITLLCLAGSSFVFFYINRSIILRLHNLSDSMHAHVAGRPVAIGTSGSDEIAEMAKATQYFLHSIEKREAALRVTFENMRTILEASPIGSCVTTEEGQMLFCNSEFANQHGFPRDALKDVDLVSLLCHPADRARLFAQLRRGGAVDHVEIQRRRTDGTPWWSMMSMRAITFEGQEATLTWTYNISALKGVEEELRALGDVSQAVNSTLDLETVLTTIVAKATQLSNTDAGAIYVFDDASREFRLRATYGMDDTIIAEIRDRHIHLGETAVGRAAEQRMPIQVFDIQSEPSAVLDVIVRAGFRALLTVPLLGADRIVGALVVRRKQPGEFPKSTVDLLQTFAAQSVLAIQNARLFDNVETRTRELARSLNDLRTAQDRLVQTQKLASLGQLTAGIAHEIKNPLNFVNNFSGVSVELIDELEETLGRVTADDKTRAEITELADTLRDNLDKIVQHGKRADSIVKNMLLHSREGSGERRLIDVNALVEESLNLAYHGARAEKQGFNVTLQRSFDPSAGEVDAFPQEISRVLLNLISNGFYATTKRKVEATDGAYEPTITAATKDLGESVEVRIRDNGTGILPGIREKMFNPFFTTKPTGEGTGLGLSISHDIVVKQHAGSIEVDTEPGEFTEIRIILPRIAASATGEKR